MRCYLTKVRSPRSFNLSSTKDSGAGAGQAIEDGYVLGRAMSDYFHSTGTEGLRRWLELYEIVRLPRTQKAQQTAREAGDVYEMQAGDMTGQTYEECLPLVKLRLQDRMKWIWTEDIDTAYEKARSDSDLS